MIKQPRSLLIFGLLVVSALALAWSVRPHLARIEAAGAGEPMLFAATFSSAFCSACRVLKPKLADVAAGFEDAPIRFIEYDFTFEEHEALAARAEAFGMARAFARFAPATGYALLIEAASGEVINILTMNHSRAEIRAALDDALALVAARRRAAEETDQGSSR